MYKLANDPVKVMACLDGWDEKPSDSILGEKHLDYTHVPLDYNPNICLDDTLALS